MLSEQRAVSIGEQVGNIHRETQNVAKNLRRLWAGLAIAEHCNNDGRWEIKDSDHGCGEQ